MQNLNDELWDPMAGRDEKQEGNAAEGYDDEGEGNGEEIPLSARAELARNVLGDLLDHMDVDVDIYVDEDDEQITLDVEGEDAGILIGRYGQTLDAVQLIVNKIVNRQNDQVKPIYLDGAGYRERREESLIQMAHRLKEKALHTQSVVELEPMSARDRRTIHMALRDDPEVSTYSEGEGSNRRLMIAPNANG